MLYDREALFRKRIIMEQRAYGRGEYQYFAYPLPETVAGLREQLYPPLARVANVWSERLKRRAGVSTDAGRLSGAMPRGGADPADAVNAVL